MVPDISDAALATYSLLDCVSGEGGLVDATREMLAERRGVSMRSLRRHLSELEAVGSLRRHGRAIVVVASPWEVAEGGSEQDNADTETGHQTSDTGQYTSGTGHHMSAPGHHVSGSGHQTSGGETPSSSPPRKEKTSHTLKKEKITPSDSTHDLTSSPSKKHNHNTTETPSSSTEDTSNGARDGAAVADGSGEGSGSSGPSSDGSGDSASTVADTATAEMAGEPSEDQPLDQWLHSIMADHGIEPRTGEAAQIIRRLHASELGRDDWRRYLLDRCASMGRRVGDGEIARRQAVSWMGSTRDIGFWESDQSGGRSDSLDCCYEDELTDEDVEDVDYSVPDDVEIQDPLEAFS